VHEINNLVRNVIIKGRHSMAIRKANVKVIAQAERERNRGSWCLLEVLGFEKAWPYSFNVLVK
jgi:hypothetical protein